MSEREFEDYLRDLARGLGRALPSDAVRGELRDHLEEHFAELSAAGVPREEAVRRALDEFGDSLSLAERLTWARGGARRRRVLRWSGATAIGLSFALSLLWAMWPQNARVPLASLVEAQGEPAAPAAVDGLTPDEAALETILARPVEFEFVQTPLSDVVEFLSAKTGTAITLDRAGLDSESLASDQPITFRSRGLSLANALELLTRDHGLTWTYRDEALEITTTSALEDNTGARTYDVRDLFAAAGNDADQRAELSRRLVALIESTLNPDVWEPNGGFGKATINGETLIVTSDWRTQREVRRMLAEVRQAAAGGQEGRAALPSPTDLERKIEAALRASTTVEFVETPLTDVEQFWATSLSVPLRIDRRALEAEGLSGDEPVTLRVKNATLRSTLNRLVRQQVPQLAWTVAHDAILITTESARAELVTSRIYPVADLLGAGDAESRAAALESLESSITTNLMRSSWIADGGFGVAGALPAQQVLWIRQTAEGHRQIEKLLGELRASRGKPNEGASPKGMTIRVYIVDRGDMEDFDMEQLAQMVKSLVEPDSWRNDALAYAQHVGNRLVVRQTEGCQRKVVRFLQQELKLHIAPADTAPVSGNAGGLGGGMF